MVSGGVVVLASSNRVATPPTGTRACSAEIFLLKPVEVMSAAGAGAGPVKITD